MSNYLNPFPYSSVVSFVTLPHSQTDVRISNIAITRMLDVGLYRLRKLGGSSYYTGILTWFIKWCSCYLSSWKWYLTISQVTGKKFFSWRRNGRWQYTSPTTMRSLHSWAMMLIFLLSKQHAQTQLQPVPVLFSQTRSLKDKFLSYKVLSIPLKILKFWTGSCIGKSFYCWTEVMNRRTSLFPVVLVHRNKTGCLIQHSISVHYSFVRSDVYVTIYIKWSHISNALYCYKSNGFKHLKYSSE